jgi:Zn-dependent protease
MSVDPAALVLRFGAMIASLSVHEFAHAAVAYGLGDRTAQRQGRLTLNPLAHIDPIGTVVMPLVQAITGVPTLGWARPVPVDPSRFRPGINPRLGFALVSVAGPLSNLVLALLAAAALAFGRSSLPSGALDVLALAFLMNVGLFVFNLLPVPGLDGSRLLPASLDGWQRRNQRYSGIVLLIIVAIPALSAVVLGVPTRFVARTILSLFGISGAL